jgi:hypothetical protein
MAQIDDEAFQGTTVMLFRLGKNQVGLPEGPTAFALEARNRDDQFDLSRSYRQQLETTLLVPESDHMAGLTDATLQLVGMQGPVKDGLAPNKTARWY